MLFKTLAHLESNISLSKLQPIQEPEIIECVKKRNSKKEKTEVGWLLTYQLINDESLSTEEDFSEH